MSGSGAKCAGSASSESIYLIKRLGKQETGSRVARNGASNRGRYFLLPRNYFGELPELSSTYLNDTSYVRVIPVYKREGSSYPAVWCTCVYHNSKLAHSLEKGRNEVRLYTSVSLDKGMFYEGDIVVMKRRARQLRVNGWIPNQLDYFLDWLTPDDRDWHAYNRLLNDGTNRRSSSTLIYEGELEAFNEKVHRVHNYEIAVENRILQSVKKASENLVARRQLTNKISPDFFEDLMRQGVYSGICAVSRDAQYLYAPLEAVTIVPQSLGGLLLPDNGICLRKDLAQAFREGKFYVDSRKRTVHVHESLKDDYLYIFNGVDLVKVDADLSPSSVALDFHKENVYGNFLKFKSQKEYK